MEMGAPAPSQGPSILAKLRSDMPRIREVSWLRIASMRLPSSLRSGAKLRSEMPRIREGIELRIASMRLPSSLRSGVLTIVILEG